MLVNFDDYFFNGPNACVKNFCCFLHVKFFILFVLF